ncbi:zinc finger protein 853-like isoform X1 [Girardinichthys multiradiatus]|uniref:zinc finger protein 853-like isoform X1 n=1 Tax=Girardinichthys multiradiatus TaxID=208333 RepID=UPI001FAC36EA|nr:zinc finger protein 853-like isoform X1 [Girardinichthys multiradiatus]
MSSVQHLREFIRERLTAAAEEIFSEVEKTIVRHEEDMRLLEICWKPQIKLSRIDQPEQRVSNKEVLTDPKLCKQQRSSRLDQEELEHFQIKQEPEPPEIKENQEEPEPLQIKQEPEPPEIKEDQEEAEPLQIKQEPEPPEITEEQDEAEPTRIRENQLESGHLLIKEDQEEPEFGKSMVRYQEDIRLLDYCWNPRIKLFRISTDIPKQRVCKEEEVLNEQEEPEAPRSEDGQENIKQDQEEPDHQKIKEDPGEPEPQQFEEKLEEPEGLNIKEDQEDLDLPQIKDEQEEPELPPFEEDPAGPRIKEDLKPTGIVVNPEEPEPPQFGGGHEEQHLLTFLIHSSQQIEQLLWACETNTFMDPVTDHQSVFSQSEPDTEQLHSQNPPEDQKSSAELHSFYSIVPPDPEQIQEEHYGSEPRPVQQEICRSWEEEHLKSRTSEEHGWSKAEPDAEQLHSQNPLEDQQCFIELKSVYSCVTPDPEQINDQPEPPHFQQQQEIYRSWEEEHLMGRTSWEHVWFKAEPDTQVLHYHNSPEDLHSFYSVVTPDPEQITVEHHGSEPIQQEQNKVFSSWEEEHLEAIASQDYFWFKAEPDAVQLVAHTHLAAETQDHEGTSSGETQDHEGTSSGETQDHEGTSSGVSEDQHHINPEDSETCFVCGEVLKPHRLKQHLKQHPDVKPYVCKRCGERFSEHSHLRDHMVAHLVEDLKARQRPGVKRRQKNVFCKICGRGFAELDYLKSHNKAHRGERPFCETCGKHFSSPRSLKGHMKVHERRCAKPFSCRVCKKRFASRSTKKAHMERHREEKPFSCKTCGETFHERKQFMTHKGTHSAAKPFFCKICKRLFAHRPSYTAHMKSHRKETTSACSRCGERFDDQRAEATHMKTCGKLHSCDTCGKSFSSRSRVKYHKKRGSCGGNVDLKP